MSPEIGQAATRIALFMIVGAGLTLLMVPRDSAEFVVLILTIGLGLIMLGIVALFARLGTAPRWDKAKGETFGPTGPLDGPLSGPPEGRSAGALTQDEPADDTDTEGR
jgi:hypothetical protein